MSLLQSYLANVSRTQHVRQAVLSVIVSSSIFAFGMPTLANSNEPLILVESQAVGSFLDTDDTTVQQVESNLVDGVELENLATTTHSTSSERNNLNNDQAKDTYIETVQ